MRARLTPVSLVPYRPDARAIECGACGRFCGTLRLVAWAQGEWRDAVARLPAGIVQQGSEDGMPRYRKPARIRRGTAHLDPVEVRLPFWLDCPTCGAGQVVDMSSRA